MSHNRGFTSADSASARARSKPSVAKRAFISAPLIGTILFLTAVFFSVNLAKVDNAQVTQIASDAYHNRLVSILETYRTDLKSIFTTSLTRSVEGVLTSQCWQTGPFSIKNPNGLAFASPEYASVYASTSGQPPLFQEKTERYARCRELSKLVSSNICAQSSGFGLKGWLSNLDVNISFEGLTLQPLDVKRPGSDQTYFEEFLNTINDPSCSVISDPTARQQCEQGVGRTPSLCNKLIADNHLFDCHAFADRAENPQNPLRCCTQQFFDTHPADPATGMVPSCTQPQDIQPGCEDGTFFMNVKTTDPVLFPRMPRIQATDGRGNEIRSGAVADGDLPIHIEFPLFYYYDAGFVLYRPLAYGVPAGGLQPSDVNAGKYSCQGTGQGYRGQWSEGVVEGACAGSAQTCHEAFQGSFPQDRVASFLQAAGKTPFTPTCTDGNSDFAEGPGNVDGEQAKNRLAQDYAANVLLPSIQFVQGLSSVYRAPSTTNPLLCGSAGSSSVPRLCPKLLSGHSGGVDTFFDNVAGTPTDANSLSTAVSQYVTAQHSNAAGGGWAAYLDRVSFEVHLQDQSPVYQVDPGKPNDYCFQAVPYLYEPTS